MTLFSDRESKTVIEILATFDPVSKEAVNGWYNESIEMFLSTFQLKSHKEKIELIQKERKLIFDTLEDKTIIGFTHILYKNANQANDLFLKAISFSPNIKEQMPTEMRAMGESIINTATDLANNSESISLSDIEQLLTFITSETSPVPILAKYITAERPIRSIITGAFYLHYNKEFLIYLNGMLDELENPQLTISNQITTEKIEWLGTQKQLAELFVELENKGWIKEKKAELIKYYFTKSDSIQQILKPAQDIKTKKANYDGIYTPNYKASFIDIKPNKS
jgi:hypothetical protein